MSVTQGRTVQINDATFYAGDERQFVWDANADLGCTPGGGTDEGRLLRTPLPREPLDRRALERRGRASLDLALRDASVVDGTGESLGRATHELGGIVAGQSIVGTGQPTNSAAWGQGRPVITRGGHDKRMASRTSRETFVWAPGFTGRMRYGSPALGQRTNISGSHKCSSQKCAIAFDV